MKLNGKWKSLPLEFDYSKDFNNGANACAGIEELCEDDFEEPTFAELLAQNNVSYDFDEVLASLDDFEKTQDTKKPVTQEAASTEKVWKARPIEIDPEYPPVDPAECGSWGCFNIEPTILLPKIMALGFKEPTEVQQAVFPIAISSNKNVVCAAPTGSGKTLSFGIPIVNRAVVTKQGDGALRNLIIVSSRELAKQIQKELKKIIPKQGVNVLALIGGLNEGPQEERLIQRKPCIVVATAGRLIDFVTRTHSPISFADVDTLILDECDQLLSGSNLDQMKKIFAAFKTVDAGKERQGKMPRRTLLFSATLSLPEETLLSLSEKDRRKETKLQDDVNSVTGDVSIDRLISFLPILGGEPKLVNLSKDEFVNEDIKLLTCYASNEDKNTYLYCALMDPNFKTNKVIIFVNSDKAAKKLASLLNDLGFKAGTLYSGKMQKKRFQAFEKASSADKYILVTTDVASRGLDIPDLDLVVHYHQPRNIRVFVHRSGRTGRAGKSGVALCLQAPEELPAYQHMIRPAVGEHRFTKWSPDATTLGPARERVKIASRLVNAKDQYAESKRSNAGISADFAAEAYNYDVEDHEALPAAYLKKREEKKSKDKISSLKQQLDDKKSQTFLRAGINKTQQAHEAVMKRRRQ